INGANHFPVGGTAASARNVISGNGNVGVLLSGSGTTAIKISRNYIGTNAAGTAAVGNAHGGVSITSAPSNQIGGTAAGEGNVISGNNPGNGITSFDSTDLQVQGNLIGTDAAGSSALPNAIGISVARASGTATATIGATSSAGRNVVSGNAASGIVL